MWGEGRESGVTAQGTVLGTEEGVPGEGYDKLLLPGDGTVLPGQQFVSERVR
jgi:hypothetical protein